MTCLLILKNQCITKAICKYCLQTNHEWHQSSPMLMHELHGLHNSKKPLFLFLRSIFHLLPHVPPVQKWTWNLNLHSTHSFIQLLLLPVSGSNTNTYKHMQAHYPTAVLCFTSACSITEFIFVGLLNVKQKIFVKLN